MGVKRKQADALSGGLTLGKFDRGDWPLSFVAPDRDSKAVQFVKANILHRARFSAPRPGASSVWGRPQQVYGARI